MAERYQIDPSLLATPAAKRAMQAGILEAREQAMRRAETLSRLGWPLLLGIIFVSFLHIWESVAAIVPTSVEALHLPAIVYHAASAALTIGIDLVALYVVAAGSIAVAAGGKRNTTAIVFLFGITLILNLVYVARYAPLPTGWRDTMEPLTGVALLILLPGFVPLSMWAIESTREELEHARLGLVVETVALRQLLHGAGTEIVELQAPKLQAPKPHEARKLQAPEAPKLQAPRPVEAPKLQAPEAPESPVADGATIDLGYLLEQPIVKHEASCAIPQHKANEASNEASNEAIDEASLLHAPEAMKLDAPEASGASDWLVKLQSEFAPGATVSPALLQARLGASRSTSTRLVQEAMEQGVLTQSGRGQYQVQ